jgi:SAM-dependent methyltransferase
MGYPTLQAAEWPFALPESTQDSTLQSIKDEADRLGSAAQYGWGHTIDFGPLRKDGLFGNDFLRIAGAFDEWKWWPRSLDGLRVADVGCYTGGLSLLMAHRGAATVFAVDEVPENLAQCEFVSRIFGTTTVRPIIESIYNLPQRIPTGSLDLIVLAGVLYHLSDMQIGLYALRELLKPRGTLLIETAAVEDFQHSYANHARFVGGGWWNPTALCIQDMCTFMGFEDFQIRFYSSSRCFARAVRSTADIPFRRGLNWKFDTVRDQRGRTMDHTTWAPAPWNSSFRSAK